MFNFITNARANAATLRRIETLLGDKNKHLSLADRVEHLTLCNAAAKAEIDRLCAEAEQNATHAQKLVRDLGREMARATTAEGKVKRLEAELAVHVERERKRMEGREKAVIAAAEKRRAKKAVADTGLAIAA